MSTTYAERLATVENRTTNNEKQIVTVAEKLDRMQFWIMTTFAGTVLSLLLLVLALLTRNAQGGHP